DLMDELSRYIESDRVLFLHPPQPVYVTGSRLQLTRALLNVSLNALEAQGGEGKIEIAHSVIQVEAIKRCHHGFLNRGSYACIQVSDSGSGIPEEIVDRVFEPFVTTKSRSTTGSSGSGLGLSVVAGIIDDHDGRIDLEARNPGTCVSIYLPQTENDSREREVQVLAISSQQFLEPHIDLFYKRNWKLHLVEDENDALRHASDSPPSIVFFPAAAKFEQALHHMINIHPEVFIVILQEGVQCSNPYNGLPCDYVLNMPASTADIESLFDVFAEHEVAY
ncbi:MAG: hypothetical protein HQL32_15020, partial [Planctomycetes bacterium]|nr:hypothetical protein [Planctomycetota bacterium]